MTVDCKWIENNLEALSCGTLSAEESRIARVHIESCDACAKEVAALNAIDPLIKRLFESELDRALRATTTPSRSFPRRRLAALTSAVVLAGSVLLVLQLRTQHQKAVPAAPVAQALAPSQGPEPATPVKTTEATKAERAKPVETALDDRVQSAPSLQDTDKNAPEFLVSDPAGYSRTLNDFRGHILLIGVLKPGQSDSMSNLEKLYKAAGSNPKYRFLGVFNERQARAPNTTFPLAYNKGSRLFGAGPGDFVLLDENGKILQRGSLVKDFNSLRKTLLGN